MSTYLVTGAGRGIGLELTKQLAELNVERVSKIIATTRGQPSQALGDLIAASAGRVIHVPCELTVPASIEKAADIIHSKLADDGLDVLINNVGVSTWSPLVMLASAYASGAYATVLERHSQQAQTAYVLWGTTNF